LLTKPERQQLLVDWNKTYSDYPKNKCIHQLFEEQVERTPDAIALIFEDQQLSYQMLNTKANQLAHYLKTVGVEADTLVAICMERSMDLVIGLLAILKAGGAYVPMDSSYPAARMSYLLEDSQAKILLTQAHLIWPKNSANIINIDNLTKQLSEYSDSNPKCQLTADNLAYVIYTSGSTGNPKGVMVTHANISRLFITTQPKYNFNSQDVWTLFHSYAFDFSVWEIWGALIYGGKLVIISHIKSRSPIEFYDLLIKQGVTVLNQTPSAFRQLIQIDQGREDKNVLKLRYIIFGGEALDFSSLIPWFKKHGDRMPQLVNMYGITETTVHVTYYALTQDDVWSQKSIIGKPLPDLQAYIFDKNLQPQPIGIPGELYVAGSGLSMGYLNRPELTAEKFISNPYSDQLNARLYKTGDLARWLSDGNIEYLGRIDQQIQLRGFRVELGEIESVLERHPKLREVVVTVYEPIPGDQRLVAYVVPKQNCIPNVSEFREFLKPKLPDYMMPSAFVFMDAMPLTPNGKLDRKALPEPDQHRHDLGAEFIAPNSLLENQLAEIWRDVLKIDQIGIHDNFFELGGYSLLAVKMIIDVNELFNVNLPVGSIYQSPTIEKLGASISSGNQQSTWYSLVPIQKQGSRPPLFAIHTISLEDLPFYMGKDQPLYFLRYGMAGKVTNHSVKLPQLEDLASHYIMEMQQVQPCGPYYLIGFSFGGLIAYEMACQLSANGHQVKFLGLLDSYLSWEKHLLPYHHIIYNFFSRLRPSLLLGRIKSKITTLAAPYNYGSDFWPHIYTRAPDAVCGDGFNPRSYNGHRITLFQGNISKNSLYSYEPPEQAWKTILGEKLDVQQVTGGHFEMLKEPHVKILAEKLIACMDKTINE
jgi:amino acid adenylation domain-containing protein